MELITHNTRMYAVPKYTSTHADRLAFVVAGVGGRDEDGGHAEALVSALCAGFVAACG